MERWFNTDAGFAKVSSKQFVNNYRGEFLNAFNDLIFSAPKCEAPANRFLRAVYQLRQAGLAQLVQLGEILSSWFKGVRS